MNRNDQTTNDIESTPPQDAPAFDSMTLGERVILAARLAVREHLNALARGDGVEDGAGQRNRQQAKRATTEQSIGIGGAGGNDLPAWIRVTDDPALAPLTDTHPVADQAHELRKLAARRLTSASSVEPRLREKVDTDRTTGGAAA